MISSTNNRLQLNNRHQIRSAPCLKSYLFPCILLFGALWNVNDSKLESTNKRKRNSVEKMNECFEAIAIRLLLAYLFLSIMTIRLQNLIYKKNPYNFLITKHYCTLRFSVMSQQSSNRWHRPQPNTMICSIMCANLWNCTKYQRHWVNVSWIMLYQRGPCQKDWTKKRCVIGIHHLCA